MYQKHIQRKGIWFLFKFWMIFGQIDLILNCKYKSLNTYVRRKSIIIFTDLYCDYKNNDVCIQIK